MDNIAHYFQVHILMLIGATILVGYYFGKNMRLIKLPSIIGFMIFGAILGPSFLNFFSDTLQDSLGFITDIALGFVALSIGLELKFSILKKLGKGMIYIIFLESFFAFGLVLITVYLITHNLPLALIFAGIAPASAPAGTVAVIQEYRAKGSLTKALYAVVGFDDGLGIIIFGFASAFAQSLLLQETGQESAGLFATILMPLEEIGISLLIGISIGLIFSFLSKRLKSNEDLVILIFGFVLFTCGISKLFHASIILTIMIIGIFIINTQSAALIRRIQENLKTFMPLLFILFFTLAGSNLHISAIPSLGVLGVLYIISRSLGLISGSKVGAIIGKLDKNIKKYLGLGILSQAGVAIGLSLLVKEDFHGMGKTISEGFTSGDYIGATVITTVTATSIIFEIIGPILTKYALTKAGEIKKQ